MVSVAKPGPPSVITAIWSKTFRPLISDSVKQMVKEPEISGSVMKRNRCKADAPSMVAASCTSCGTPCRAAR